MKADLYVQGNYWATIQIPGESFLALLAKGTVTEVSAKLQQLADDLNTLEGVQCSVSLRIQETITYTPGPPDQHRHDQAP